MQNYFVKLMWFLGGALLFFAVPTFFIFFNKVVSATYADALIFPALIILSIYIAYVSNNKFLNAGAITAGLASTIIFGVVLAPGGMLNNVLITVIGLIGIGGAFVFGKNIFDITRRIILKNEHLSLNDLKVIVASYFVFILCASSWFTWLYLDNNSSFSISNPTSPFIDMLYFSIVTFTTLGFGEIVPVTPEAKSLTMLFNVISFFLVGLGFGCIVKGVEK